jgi:hypothetical protein
MPVFATKVLWVVNIANATAEAAIAAHAQAAGIDTVCIRSTSADLANAIGRFHGRGFKVYSWRWPAMKPTTVAAHYFAPDEANFVVDKLIPAGLDGYIADPESDQDGAVNDWDVAGLGTLAKAFCDRIKQGAADAGLVNFRFGVTSGCGYPSDRTKMPWAEFVAASNVLLPQSYWRVTGGSANGGTPDKAITRGLTAWKPIAQGKPIVPMAGELAHITAAELAAYGNRMQSENIPEGHFYVDTGTISAAVWTAIAAL